MDANAIEVNRNFRNRLQH